MRTSVFLMAAAAATAIAATAVIAQTKSNPTTPPAAGMDMGAMKPAKKATPDGKAATASGASDEMMKAMDGMRGRMPKSMSGNADRDFMQMMIPHHQGAIDMARIELKHGKDASVKAMARKIIKDQEREIAQMKSMLAKKK